MASWSKRKVDASEINKGQEYTKDDNVSVEELNAIVNNSFNAQGTAQRSLNTVEGFQIGAVVSGETPSATINVDSTGEKIIMNLVLPKGETGEPGPPGDSGGTTDYRELSNKPKINGKELNGDLSTEDLGIEAISKEELQKELENKVDKVSGKGLSTNDYTTTEKNKLAGISAGAQVNVQADWNATSGDAFIKNKPNIPNLSDFAKTSDLANYLPLSGGTMSGPLVLTGGDAISGVGNMQLDTNGQITAKGSTSTLFGRTNSGADLYVGHSSHNLIIRGSQTRPTYNGSSMALSSDIPTVPTVNNATISLTCGARTIGSFTTNQSSNASLDFADLFLNVIYPVGSIYMSINNSSPAVYLGGSWTQIGAGYALWTASSGAGGTIGAGLPNITGDFGAKTYDADTDEQVLLGGVGLIAKLLQVEQIKIKIQELVLTHLVVVLFMVLVQQFNHQHIKFMRGEGQHRRF